MANKPLLVDGNNLFTIGFHGVRGYSHNGNNIGAIIHFMNTLRSFLEENNHDKVVVFWDGKNSAKKRKEIFPEYKANRAVKDTGQLESFEYQKIRVKQYLEEIFVRQCESIDAEADDLISYYCQISSEEDITIFSADRDLSQLISEKVCLYLPDIKRYVRYGDTISFNGFNVNINNVVLYKILVGDKSDNISGISGFGSKTLLDLCPDFEHKVYTLDEIKRKAENILLTKQKKPLLNLISGENKSNIDKENFYNIAERIINLKKPMINEEEKYEIESVYSESIDSDGRGHKNLIKLMIEDGFFKYLPKIDNAWVDYIRPFTKLIRKEKKIKL